MVAIANQQDSNVAVKVAILTPYLLLRNLNDADKSEEWKKAQVDKFGFSPDNLAGITSLLTPNGKLVGIETDENHTLISPMLADLVIAGCTEKQEAHVQKARGTGAVVARYSIFYSKPSSYTGLFPEEAGYSLDIPKNVKTVKALLTDDAVLDALVSREHSRIRDAINTLNGTLDVPILITSHLATALKRPRLVI
jgi:hypothetical protein